MTMTARDDIDDLRARHARLEAELTALAAELEHTEAGIRAAASPDRADDPITGEECAVLGSTDFELIHGHLVIDGIDHGDGEHARRLLHLLQHPPGDPDQAFEILPLAR